MSAEWTLIETRLIERYVAGDEDYWMGAFVWAPDHGDAIFAVDGQQDINQRVHDAPAQKLCGKCHRGDVGRVLGFSAIQLTASSTGPALRELSAMNLLTPAGVDLVRLWIASLPP